MKELEIKKSAVVHFWNSYILSFNFLCSCFISSLTVEYHMQNSKTILEDDICKVSVEISFFFYTHSMPRTHRPINTYILWEYFNFPTYLCGWTLNTHHIIRIDNGKKAKKKKVWKTADAKDIKHRTDNVGKATNLTHLKKKKTINKKYFQKMG